jgi:hypothetical protein
VLESAFRMFQGSVRTFEDFISAMQDLEAR